MAEEDSKWAVDADTWRRQGSSSNNIQVRRSQSAKDSRADPRRPRMKKRKEEHEWIDRDQEKKIKEEEEKSKNYEDLLSQCVSVGDRVVVDITPTKSAKPGHQGQARYRRKLVYAPGRVMYIGELEHSQDPHATYIGVNMDEPVGTSDGSLKGIRYFISSQRHGKFLPLRKLISVLDSKSGKFQKTDVLVQSLQNSDRMRANTPKLAATNEIN